MRNKRKIFWKLKKSRKLEINKNKRKQAKKEIISKF